jgi:hypothetical protein
VTSSSRTRACGVAAVMAALLFVLAGLFYYVFTHGSGGTGRGDTLFGLDYGEFGRMQFLWPILLALGLLAYHATILPNAGRLARRGLVVSLVALAIEVVAVVLQYWVVDPDIPSEFDSLPSTLGFYLGSLSFLLLAIGLVLTGIEANRADARPRWFALPLVTGLLVMPTMIFPLLGFSDGTRTWEIIFTASRVPLALCFALLGAVLELEATSTTHLRTAAVPARQVSRSIG